MTKRGILEGSHPSRQLLLAGLSFVGSWIFFQLLAMFTGIFIYHLSLTELVNSLSEIDRPEIVSFLKYVQAVSSAGMFIFAAMLTAWFIDGDWKSFLGLRNKPGWLISFYAVLFIIIIFPFTNFLSYLNSNLHLPGFMEGVENFFRNQETQMNTVMEKFLRPSGPWSLLVNLLVIAVIPAIGEELTFRGVVQKVLIRWFRNPHTAIFVTAIFFSALHFQFLSFLPRFFLGMVLGYMFYWSKSIWLTILVHFVNNAMAVVYYNFYYGGFTDDSVEKAGTPGNDIYLTFIGIAVGGVFLYQIYKYRKERKTSTDLQTGILE
ncbi:MAG: CPBP family intramembrane metalloprotease [Bacteroidales bacterium]|nr:CPBP family intramembrane metalloprotease [Bacteroidales bacterium]MCB8998744.1 CPBP family intramembrane metalloprotease [Bacteroidales bacterium]